MEFQRQHTCRPAGEHKKSRLSEALHLPELAARSSSFQLPILRRTRMPFRSESRWPSAGEIRLVAPAPRCERSAARHRWNTHSLSAESSHDARPAPTRQENLRVAMTIARSGNLL